MSDPHLIQSEAELREVIREPSPAVEQKIFDHVDPYAAAFIEKAPLLLLATRGADGGLDVSPKGDAPGFVRVADEKTLLIPDRPGNKLAYGFPQHPRRSRRRAHLRRARTSRRPCA